MPKIDNLVVFRCVQVVRRLLLKNRDIGLFCNLSGSTLIDGAVFQQLLEFLDANRAIAPSMVLEFTQSALRAAGPIENESLVALADRGFRFSLDNLQDLRIEPRELATAASASSRFREACCSIPRHAAADIHPADLSDLLGRFGIDLIAEKIESEAMVVDLLDYDVRFGQGFLFSPPRPVRAEALQGIADRSDVIVREASAADDAPAPARPRATAARRPSPTARDTRRAPPAWPSSPAASAAFDTMRCGSSKSSRPRLYDLISMSPTVPAFSSHFSTLAPNYDVLLCDVWGVVHNGVAATPNACDALRQFRTRGGTVVLITNAPRPGDFVQKFIDRPQGAARQLRRDRQLRRRDARAGP